MNKKISILIVCLLMSSGFFVIAGEVGAVDCITCEQQNFAGAFTPAEYQNCLATCGTSVQKCPSPCSPTAMQGTNAEGKIIVCSVCPAAIKCPTCGSAAVTVPNGYGGTISCKATAPCDPCNGMCSASEVCVDGSCQNKTTTASTTPATTASPTPATVAPATKASVPAVPAAARDSGDVKIDDPLSLGTNPIPTLANRLIMAALGLTGVLALLSFIYGGILYMLVGVNPDNVKKGKDVMKWSVVGLFIVFSAYAILNFLLGTVLGIK